MQSGWLPGSFSPTTDSIGPAGGSITNLTSSLILLMIYQSQPLKTPMSHENIQLWLGFN